jgi:hypothetical protein
MAKYTVVLTRMMSQVHTVEASDLKAAVAEAMDKATLMPDSGNDFDAAGDEEVQVIELDGEEVWNTDRDSEDDLF